MKRLTIRGTALSFGLFFDVSFVLCVLWGLLAPQGFTKMAGLLEVIFPGGRRAEVTEPTAMTEALHHR